MQLYNYRVKRKRKYHGYSSGHHRRHRRSYHRRRRKNAWRRLVRILGITVIVLVLLAALGVGAFTYLRSSGKRSLMEAANSSGPSVEGQEEGSGVVSRNGKRYTYNEDMINILCMGIDKDTERWAETEDAGENGQADTIFLLALDLKKNTMRLLGISRDTMTEIRTYDRQGNYVGETVNHLGLAYAFGDGRSGSGELMTEAVSKLLYNLPIHGYAAINLDAIEKLNDSVGGVTVTLSEDLTISGEELSKGDTITLTGEQAHSFVRQRDMEKEGSNNLRMERQKQYAIAFVNEAKQAIKKDLTLPFNLYQNLTEDMVTSIGVDEAVYLASLLPGIRFDLEDIQMLAGETKQGSVYEEFYVDEEALLDTVLQVFYTEVKE